MSPTRFVALGDSITVGIGDPMPGGSWRGWAVLLAEAFDAVEFHNLAELGAQTRHVASHQLPRALALRPTVAAVVVGVNDTLRNTFDAGAIGRSLEHTVGSLRVAGIHVLTCRLPDPARMFGLPRALARPLSRRIRAVNAVADRVAARHGTVHFDAANHPEVYDRRNWSIDRLHPSEWGHRLIAATYADRLARAGLAIRPVGREPTNPQPTRRAQAHWMATKGTKWMLDRSTDLVPYLLSMALAEWWHNLRGRAQRIEEVLALDLVRVLDQLDAIGPWEPVDPAWAPSAGQRQATAVGGLR